MTPAPRAALAKTALVVIASAASACAPAMKLPAGPGAPAPDARQAFAEATVSCRAISTMTLEAAVTGSIDGRRLPRGRLLVGLAAPSSARVEAPASFGAPLFVFVARDGDATLLLERDLRVLEHGRPDAVLEALAGVPLDAAGLRATLTGCSGVSDASDPNLSGSLVGRQLGDDWRMILQGSDSAYLHRASSSASWQLVAAVRRVGQDAGTASYRVEYGDFLHGLPLNVRLTSIDAHRFDLRLTLSQVEVNIPLEDRVFRLQIPPFTQPIDLEELRRSGPLGAPRSNGR